MSLQSLVSIVLRLFCIQWVVTGISYLFPMFYTWNNGYDTRVRLALYLGPVFFIVISVIFWHRTPAIAHAVTRREASKVNIPVLTRHDLYCFAFVLVGLNFVLSNLSSAMINLYQFVVVQSQTHGDSAHGRTSYDLARYTMSLAAGGICLLYASHFSTRLIRMEQKRDKADGGVGSGETAGVVAPADAPLP